MARGFQGILGFADENKLRHLRRVRDVLVNNGLRTKITPHIRLLGFSVVNDIPKPTGNILWTFDSSDRLEEIHRALEDNYHAVVGTLLGYPGCCIAANRESKLLGAQTFIKAIIAKVGPDPIAVKRALDNNEQVEVPDDADPQANHVPLTDEKFPFVFHIACDACLNSDDSPSAALNEDSDVSQRLWMKGCTTES